MLFDSKIKDEEKKEKEKGEKDEDLEFRMEHIKNVQKNIMCITTELVCRAAIHDAGKLGLPTHDKEDLHDKDPKKLNLLDALEILADWKGYADMEEDKEFVEVILEKLEESEIPKKIVKLMLFTAKDLEWLSGEDVGYIKGKCEEDE